MCYTVLGRRVRSRLSEAFQSLLSPHLLVPLAVLAFVALCPVTRAQTSGTGTITGRVLNAATGKYLSKARVRVEGTNIETFTDDFGDYELDDVPSGSVTLDVFYTGEEPLTQHVVVSAGKTSSADITFNENGTSSNNVLRLKEFVVRSQRETNADAIAINQQRFAANIKNVVSTDAFGEVNQGNVGEFVKHLPGVTIEYKDGNNPSGIDIRGFGSNYTNVTMDGGQLASAALANTSKYSRQFVLEGANINNIARIEVTKEPLPNMPANSLGGSVNFISKSAFEYAKPQLHFETYLSGNSYDLTLNKTPGPSRDNSYKVLPSFNATYILPVNRKFGIVITAADESQYYMTKKNSPVRVFNRSSSDSSRAATVTDPYTQRFSVSDSPNKVESTSGSIKLDWKPSEANLLQFTAQATAYRQDSASDSISYNVGNTLPVDWGETFTHGAAGSASANIGGSWQNRNSLLRAVSGKYTFNHNGWKVVLAANYSNSNNRVHDKGKGFFHQISTTLDGVSSINFDKIDNGSMNIGSVSVLDSSGNPIDPTKLSSYKLRSVNSQPMKAQDTITEYRLDVRKAVDIHGINFAVQAGGSTNYNVQDINYWDDQIDYVGPDGIANSGDENMGNMVDPSGTYNLGYGLSSYQWASPWVIYNLYQNHPSYFQETQNEYGSAVKNHAVRSPLLMERVSAGYLMTDTKFFHNRIRVAGGVRWELTEDAGYGYKQDADAIYQRDSSGKLITDSNGKYILKSNLVGTSSKGPERYALIYQYRGQYNARHYHQFFPSASVTAELRRNLLLRLAYAKTIGRPPTYDIVPNDYIGSNPYYDPNVNGSYGGYIVSSNTNLKPWTAKNYDLSLEYYFAKTGVLSAGVFRKDITNFFASTHTTATAALLDQLGLSHDYIGWYYGIRKNVGNARVDGLEINYSQNLAFLGEVGKSFTVMANFTRLNLSGANGTPSAFNSFIPTSGNLGMSYSKGPFSLGVYWNYRGKQLRDTSNAYPGANEYILPIRQVDANISYQLTKHFAIYLAGRNITNAVTQWSLDGPVAPDWAKVENDFTNGAQYTLGLKGNF